MIRRIYRRRYLLLDTALEFILTDGKSYKILPTAKDYKRIGEGDTGLNTGGMGAYSPSRLESENLDKKILDQIINPTIKALEDMNTKFKGFLYAGLMIVQNEPYLIEYNVRMGDPECQTILPRLKTNFFEIVKAVINENLGQINIEWSNNKTLSIVLCSQGYPESFESDKEIKNLDKIFFKKNEFIFHAGTKIKNTKIISSGGRILNFVAGSTSFNECRKIVFELIKKVDLKKSFYRKDIGYRVINK